MKLRRRIGTMLKKNKKKGRCRIGNALLNKLFVEFLFVLLVGRDKLI